VLLSGCAAGGNAFSAVTDRSLKNCEFSYTPTVREQLIVPELEKSFGEAYVFFDYDNPVVFVEKQNVTVQLSATKVINGHRILFEDLFLVVLDKCGTRTLRSFATQQYHKE
jgi:hypothetical protein